MATRIIEVQAIGTAAERRRFSEDDKARIVSEAMAPGTSVKEVARRNGVCSSLVHRWRRKLLTVWLAPGMMLPAQAGAAQESGFVPVQVGVAAAPAGSIEVITAAGARVRLAPPIDPRLLKAVLATLA